MTTPPTCGYCRRPYADPAGCDPGPPGEIDPVRYGDELHPLSHTPACRDCGAPAGRLHHVGCSVAECPDCHLQWHGVDTSCAENRLLVAGGGAT